MEALGYYPYGAERIHSGSADADRTFIGQFGDDASREQFQSEGPVDHAIGERASLRGELSPLQHGSSTLDCGLHGPGQWTVKECQILTHAAQGDCVFTD